MPVNEAVEVSDDDIRVQYSDRAFRRAQKEYGPVPATMDGKYVSAYFVVTNVKLDDTTENQLKTAINAIAGVAGVKHIAQARVPINRVPADTAETTFGLYARATLQWDIKATPVTP